MRRSRYPDIPVVVTCKKLWNRLSVPDELDGDARDLIF